MVPTESSRTSRIFQVNDPCASESGAVTVGFVGYFTGNKIIDKLKQTATRTQA